MIENAKRDYQSCQRKYFDCRRYIRPGDRVAYRSIWCDTAKGDADATPVPGIVIAVYPKFVMVITPGGLIEGVNRWNIRQLNGRKVPESGYFYGLPTVAEREHLC